MVELEQTFDCRRIDQIGMPGMSGLGGLDGARIGAGAGTAGLQPGTGRSQRHVSGADVRVRPYMSGANYSRSGSVSFRGFRGTVAGLSAGTLAANVHSSRPRCGPVAPVVARFFLLSLAALPRYEGQIEAVPAALPSQIVLPRQAHVISSVEEVLGLISRL